MAEEYFMVFDVESVGLHGEGFAVAYVVVNRYGARQEEGLMACDPIAATGTDADREWIAANVPALDLTHRSPAQVRDAFWTQWMRWRGVGAVLVADCAWPVEARFLAAAVDDGRGDRNWEGPYPLHDLASVLLANGVNPLTASGRLPSELPAHHPLMDARQSARILIDALSNHAAQTPQP